MTTRDHLKWTRPFKPKKSFKHTNSCRSYWIRKFAFASMGILAFSYTGLGSQSIPERCRDIPKDVRPNATRSERILYYDCAVHDVYQKISSIQKIRRNGFDYELQKPQEGVLWYLSIRESNDTSNKNPNRSPLGGMIYFEKPGLDQVPFVTLHWHDKSKEDISFYPDLSRMLTEGGRKAEDISKLVHQFSKDTGLGEILKLAKGVQALADIKPLPDILLKKGTDPITAKGAQLEGLDLEGAQLAGANLANANLKGARLKNAQLKGAWLSEADLTEANLEGANLEDLKGDKAIFTGAQLTKANFKKAVLTNSVFLKSNLTQANMEGTWMNSANFNDANLQSANLSHARLGLAELQKTNLKKANLNSAFLRKANLTNANLSEASLIQTNFYEANLWGADLRKANLGGANLCWSVVWRAQFEGARTNKDTVMPTLWCCQVRSGPSHLDD